MDKLQWFKFTPSDWMMGKIQRCPEITQARFIRLCCLYWNKESNLLRDDAIIEIDQEHYDILLSKKIITDDDVHVSIHFLDEQLEDIAETSKGKSRAAKIRWEKHKKDKAGAMQNDADAMHVHTGAMQNDAEKRREEEIREEEKKRNDSNESLFNIFWSKYPNKVAKGNCKKKFLKLKQPEIEKILSTIDAYVAHKPFETYNHPNPETYLNQKRWEDEIEVNTLKHKPTIYDPFVDYMEELNKKYAHLNQPKK